MGFKCGIVGLPNVGKSTLFNALTANNNAAAANFPFCTIEPNSALVPVFDERLYKLAKLANSKNIIPSYIEFVDIAGLVKGASKGEGLGNQFLSHIREVDAIVHVLRDFSDSNVIHVHNKVDPLYDSDIVEVELILADIISVEKRILSLEKKIKAQDKQAKEQVSLLREILNILESGKSIRNMPNFIEKSLQISQLQLLTSKPIIYVLNVDEDKINNTDLLRLAEEYSKKQRAKVLLISAQIEAEISLLSTEEQKEFLINLGMNQTGLTQLIHAGYKVLNLQNFFTIGPKEARAWTLEKGTLAPKAAGVIHTDFERGFIRAEVIAYEDYIQYQGEVKAKEAGKMRLEGKDYTVCDGDVIHFRFNV